MANKIFVNGLWHNELSPSTPDFVKTRCSIHVDKLMQWLEENKQIANEKGYINIDGMVSKDGKTRYFEVNTYKPEPRGEARGAVSNEKSVNPDEVIDSSDIPF